jgi:hypothetical protein
MSWSQEPRGHSIVLMNVELLLCSCGEALKTAEETARLSQRYIYDELLDRHARHQQNAKRRNK